MISDADLIAWTRADDLDVPELRRLERAAIQAVQQLTGRYYGVTANITETIRFRGFPLQLANDPIGGTLISLEQWDGSAWSTALASTYTVHNSFVFSEGSWSTLSLTMFRVTYQAGYTVDPSDPNVWSAPTDIQQAVKLLVGHWFENRESVVVGAMAAEVPMSVQMLLSARARVTV